MILKKDSFEWLFVGLFLLCLGYIGMGEMLSHKIVHPFPYGLSASDAFGEVAFAEGVVDLGGYKVIPSHIRAGFDDTVGFHMPIFYHIVANLSIAAGVPVWSAGVFAATFFSLLVVLLMYLMIREYSRNVAILSLPLTIFMYIGSFKIVYSWGVWDLVLATCFMLASMWVLSKLEQPLMWVMLGILSASTALTHIIEAFFFGVFAGLYLGVIWVKGKLTLGYMKKLVWGGLLSLALSLYYLIIFKNGYGKSGGGLSIGYQAPEWFDVIFSNFGWVRFLLLLGMAAWIVVILSKKEDIALLVAPFMLLIGFTNFVSSLAPRAFQTRYFWPVYLSVFLGLCVFMLLRFLIKDWKMWQSIAISVVLVIAIGTQFYQKFGTQGLMDADHWQLFEWVKSSTRQNDRLLYFYGDIYTQEAVLWLQKRLSYRVNMQDLVSAIQERKIQRSYEAEVAAADDTGWMYRTGAFSFAYHGETANRSEIGGDMDICRFDYWVFDRSGSQQALAQYNILIANELLNNSAQVAFVNDKVVALKNTKKGGECIAERDFG
jgi:hypothetical protein